MLKNLHRYRLIPFVQYNKLWLFISAIAIIIGIVTMVGNSRTIGSPLFLGIDFTGGSFIALKLDEPGNARAIADIAANYSVGEPVVRLRRKDPREVEIRLRIDTGDAAPEAEQNTVRNIKIGEMIDEIAVEYGGGKPTISTTEETAPVEAAEPPASEEDVPLETTAEDEAAADTELSEDAGEMPEAEEENEVAAGVADDATPPEDGAQEPAEEPAAEEEAEVSHGVQVLARDYVGPVVGGELIRNAIIALILGTLAIMIFIFIRFNRFVFAIAAVVALVHDVAIALTGTAILKLEVNSFFIAVILTIIGYSINDTIIIYDRIRENLHNFPQMNFPTIINLSLTQTLTRSVMTVGTVIVMLVALLLFGGAAIYNFSMAMLFGMISGAYSSVFIAAPIVLFFTREERKARIPRTIDLLAAQEQAALGMFDEDDVVVDEDDEKPAKIELKADTAPKAAAERPKPTAPDRKAAKAEKSLKKKKKARRR